MKKKGSEFVVLDASALLALINQEAGADKVRDFFPKVIMSAVNVAEVATVLHQVGMGLDEVSTLLNDLLPEIIPFEKKYIYQTAFLREKARHLGLSFADRACLSLGLIHQYPILTADKSWAGLSLPVVIHQIR